MIWWSLLRPLLRLLNKRYEVAASIPRLDVMIDLLLAFRVSSFVLVLGPAEERGPSVRLERPMR